MVRSRSHVHGFALVEMLIVVALFGLFASWFVPIIYSAREAARMAICVDNLRKIGVAAGSYHKAHGQFPPGVLAHPRMNYTYSNQGDFEQMVGVHLFLAPYYDGGAGAFETVEEALGTLQVDYAPGQNDLPAFWDRNDAWNVAQRQFPQLICPTVGPGPPLERISIGYFYRQDCTVTSFQMGSSTNLGRTDYLGCSGYFGATCDLASAIDGRPISDFVGAFGIRTKTSLADITDGASNTYLFGEAPGEYGENVGRNRDLNGHTIGNAWIANMTLSTAFGFEPSVFDDGASDGPTYRAHWAVFASLHPVVIHWIYADGSAHALLKTTDPVIIRNMSGIADGAPVNPPADSTKPRASKRREPFHYSAKLLTIGRPK